MSNTKHNISVIIPTYNVQDFIAQAITSVQWADEVFVVDSFSTDDTVRIAREMGARVIQHEYVYSAKQKNWTIPQAKHEWVLLLDSDEVATVELKKTIISLLDSDNLSDYDGFGIARKHYFLGKFLRFGGRYPLHNIRFFRRSCRYEDRNVHAHIILPKERMKNITGDILHYSDRTLTQFFEKFNRYSTWQAQYMLKVQQRGIRSISVKEFLRNPYYAKSVVKDLWTFTPFTPFIRFCYMYIVRLGFLDGRHGFLIALFYSFQDYVAKTKYLELRQRQPRMRLYLQKRLVNFVARTRTAGGATQFAQDFNHHFSLERK